MQHRRVFSFCSKGGTLPEGAKRDSACRGLNSSPDPVDKKLLSGGRTTGGCEGQFSSPKQPSRIFIQKKFVQKSAKVKL
jgi:hypothetical protein